MDTIVSTNPLNPTDEERYAMFKKELKKTNRLEDFDNVIKLLGPSKDITEYAPLRSLKGVKIGIIGGGVSGLASAFELRKLGADITIYEAEDHRIGGRIYTHYFDKNKKHYGELGAMRVPVSHETSWFYINLFKLETLPFVQVNPNTFLWIRRTRTRNNPKDIQKYIYPLFDLSETEKNTPWNTLITYASNYFIKTMSPNERTENLRILKEYSPLYNKYSTLDTRCALTSLNLSESAIELISSIDPFLGALFYSANGETMQGTYTLEFSNLYRIKGGMVNLPLAFYNSLKSDCPKEYKNIPSDALGKCEFKANHRVTGIYKTHEDNKTLIEYKNNNDSGYGFKSFDYVICTIPFSILREVTLNPGFSPKKMQAIREVTYENSHKVYFYCKKRFWEEDMPYGGIKGGISSTDEAIQTIAYPSDHVYKKSYSLDEPGVLLAAYNLGLDSTRVGNMTSNNEIEFVKRSVERVHSLPYGFLEDLVTDYKSYNWNGAPNFKGAFCIMAPWQKQLFAYDIIQPEYDDRVFFAGEHISPTHGWIQGALSTARTAANSIAIANIKNKTVFEV
ncbi:flavin monoamine oxidase family protein [Clostridium hydrogeniformans]|uniref:flavin monoamine oxidase family protein n=1 Tax=Clostridium hydrogeniformans TaxID=349933 RepID=UPI0004899CF9|nr:NAD(P)/FAD-dependent oxidoreductase [Clostridium hydrogeniformans]